MRVFKHVKVTVKAMPVSLLRVRRGVACTMKTTHSR